MVVHVYFAELVDHVEETSVRLLAHALLKAARKAQPQCTFTSLSHTSGIAMVALAESEVGCDVERTFPLDTDELMRLLPAELKDTPDPQGAFYRWWTLSEALAKASGRALDDVLRDPPREVPPTGWHASELTPTSDHRGAVIVRASDASVVVHWW